MSTQRYISTSFWDDEWIQTLDPSEKLLYLYFMTNPLTNIAGVYKVTERRVSFDTGFNISTIQHIMSKFEKAGKVFRHGEWIALPTWPKHQRVSDRDNNRKGIDAILKALPDDVFAFIVEKGYKYIYLNELGRALEGASTTFNYSNLDIDLDIESNLDIESDLRKTPDKPAKGKAKNLYSQDFENFWDIYPKREGKKQAYKVFNALIKNGINQEIIHERLKVYKGRISALNTTYGYLRNPATFLNNLEDYADGFIPQQKKTYSKPVRDMSNGYTLPEGMDEMPGEA